MARQQDRGSIYKCRQPACALRNKSLSSDMWQTILMIISVSSIQTAKTLTACKGTKNSKNDKRQKRQKQRFGGDFCAKKLLFNRFSGQKWVEMMTKMG